MTRTRALWTFLLLALLTGPAWAADLDPLLRGFNTAHAPGKPEFRFDLERMIALEQGVGSETRVGVILHLEGTELPDLTGVAGITVGSSSGGFATARLPVRSLGALASVAGIRYVEAARIQHPKLDVAVPETNVTAVWNGAPAYTGNGVLVGVIDSGVYFRHEDFRNGSTTRIKALYDLFATGGTPPEGFGSGREYSESEINATLSGGTTVTEVDISGHGTHVTGTAAGNGAASGGTYRGVAYESDILFAKPHDDVGGGFPEDKTIDAMNWIVQKAQSLGQPIVVNMSLGGHFGPHDGTTAQEQVVNSLSGDGVIFCIAAGNEGGNFLHHSGPASNTTMIFRILDYQPGPEAGDDVAAIDIWLDGPATVTVTGPGGGTSGPISNGQQFGQNTTDGVILVDNAVSGANPLNGDFEVLIQLDDQGGTSVQPGDWTVTISGGSGTAHAWNYFSSMTAGFNDSDQSHSLGMPATAEQAVTVGAYKTRNSWPSQDGTQSYTGPFGDAPVGGIAPFSSIGPTRDGRQKPEITAPGMAMVSAYSPDATQVPTSDRLSGDKYYATQGTSMATPFTAGVVALMLEKNGTLNPGTIKSILGGSARTDAHTGGVWNATYGNGKINAQAAVAAVDGGIVPAATGDLDGSGTAGIADVVRLVNHVLDPTGNPLSSAERARADVFPPGGGDALLNVQDVTRIVAFILESDAPSAPRPGLDPASLRVGAPRRGRGGWEVPVTLRGDALAGGQFALDLPGARWSTGALRLEPAGVATASAHAVGSQIRVLVYAPAGALPNNGITVVLPMDTAPSLESLRLVGALASDRGGFARDLSVDSEARVLPVVHLQATPNPIVERTRIAWQLAEATEARLELFDLRGRSVRVLTEGTLPAGAGEIIWDGEDGSGRRTAAGVYFLRLATPLGTKTHKLVVER